jgi:hypothetical protein
MNNLTIAIYIYGLIGNLNPVLVILMLAAGITAVIAGIAYVINRSLVYDNIDWPKLRRKYRSFARVSSRIRNRALIVFCVAAFFAVIIPRDSIIRLMLVSEVGQRVIETETVQSFVDPSLQYLRNWLNEQVAVQNNNRNTNR